MSIWNSLDSLNSLNIILQWAAAVCGVGVVIVSMRVGTLSGLKDADKDKRLTVAEEKQTPRTLSTKQKAGLAGVLGRLKKFPLTIGYAASDNEARAFASDFVDIFKAAGWAIDFKAFLDVHGDGVIVSTPGGANTKSARNISRVLRAVGVQNSLEASPPQLSFPVLLFVGHKNAVR